MHWLPEKVEVKLLAMTLVISIGASLFATQLLLSTEEESLVEKTKNDLKGLSQQHEFNIINEFNARTVQGIEVGRKIQTAWSSNAPNTTPQPLLWDVQVDGSKVGISQDFISSYYASTDSEVSDEINHKIARVVQSFKEIPLDYLSHFRNITFISADNISVSSPPSQYSLMPSTDESNQHPILQMVAGLDKNTKPFWTPVTVQAGHNTLTTTLVIPLFNDNTLIGVLVSDYSMNDIFSELTNGTLENAFIMRGGDEIITHSNLNANILKHFRTTGHGLLTSEIIDPGTQSILHAFASPIPNHPFIFTENNNTHIIKTIDVGHNDWTLVVYRSTNYIDATIERIRWKVTVGALIIAFALMFVMRDVFHRLFLKRIIELEQATHDYGTNEEFIIPNPGKDEIGQLAYSFQELIHSLESGKTRISEQSQQLEQETEERLQALGSLEESEAKFRTLFEKSSDAIMILDDERCIDCNDSTIALFQFSQKSELLNTHFMDMTPKFQPDGHSSKVDWNKHAHHALSKGKHHFEWQIKTQQDNLIWVDVLLTEIPYQGHSVLHAVMRNITDRKNEDMERVRLTTAIEQAAESIMVTDTSGEIVYINPAFENMNLYTREDILNQNYDLLYGLDDTTDFKKDIYDTLMQGDVWKGIIKYKRKDGSEYKADCTVSPVRDNAKNIKNFVFVSRDVSKEIMMELQLRQAQKMEAIGELASGIAHEINTPTQYIGDNIRFFRDSFVDLRKLLNEYKKLLTIAPNEDTAAQLRLSIQKIIDDIDLEYLEEEIPIAIEQSLDGNSRVAEIVRAMKEFAHPGAEKRTAININHSIKNTLSVARNEWKYIAEIETDLAPDIPLLTCFPGSLNQVILNLVVNACHAISDTLVENNTEKGTITISTTYDDTWLEIRIGDTGCGIPEDIRMKIFDPFFTTKEVGKGTGQGLSIAHSVIVEKHNGTIDIESEVGKGTTFILKIPITLV